MASDMDDPFTTPRHAREPALDLDSPPMLARPSTSPAQLKRTLQAHLTETRKRLDGAGQLGRDLVKQEEEIEARLRDVEASGGKVGPELKKKLAELEKEYNEVGRETARALLTNKIMSSGGVSPLSGSNHAATSTTLQSQGSSSPTKLAIPTSRRQRNQASRQHDLEFAAELGQGLIAEVRKLQLLLSEREEALKVVQLERIRLEQHAETIEGRLRLMDDSEQRFKEENWNLELVIQDLHSKQAEQKDSETRMQANIAQLEHEKTMVIKELDDMKHQHSRLSEELESTHKHTETEIGSLRRALAINDTEKATLRKNVEELKSELEESHNTSMRLRSMQERQDAEERRDPFDLSLPSDDTPDHSPPPSPTKHTPRHGQLEAETLKSSLHHAHRLIQNLRSNMHREKTEKNELKRLLQDTRDELETVRNGFSSPPPREKRRRPDGTFKRLPRASINLLGGARRSKDEVMFEVTAPVDDEWEEANDEDTDAHIRRTPGAYISSVPATDQEGESSFETANERDDTATENEATETEAYGTGLESPINDNPTSGDDLTETEENSFRVLRSNASALSSRSLRPLGLSKLRQQRSSIVSTASTEDDDDDRYDLYRYSRSGAEPEEMYSPTARRYDEGVMRTPAALTNPRLRLRINRARTKVTRMNSTDSNMFNSNVFAGGIDSSPASINSPSSNNESPRAFRSSTAPDIRKSLFAELGNSPSMMSTDGEDVEETGTLNKKLSPSLMPREMVDCGVMTEEPYPDIPIFLDDSASDISSDRPSTAVTVVNDTGMLGVGSIFDRKPDLEPTRAAPEMVDAGVQSMEEVKPIFSEIGVQSDEIPAVEIVEMGTQSDEIPAPTTIEMGTQSDEIPAPLTFEMGTQSDEIPVPLTFEMGTQSDETPVVSTSEMGTQSDKAPVPLTNEVGTQSNEVLPPQMSEMGTQFDPELESLGKLAVVIVPVIETIAKEMSDNGTQFDPEIERAEEEEKEEAVLVLEIPPEFKIVHGDALETVPVEEELEPVAPPKEAVVPNFVLMRGDSIETTPVEELEPPKEEVVVPTFVLVKGGSIETTPVEEPEHVSPKEEVAVPAFILVKGEPVETAPVEEPEPIVPAIPAFALVKGVSIETAPVEEPKTIVLPKETAFVLVKGEPVETTPVEELVIVAPIQPLPPIALGFSSVVTLSTEPINPRLQTPPGPFYTAAPVATMVDTAVSSDEDTPKKVSETIEDVPLRSSTPTPSTERRGFFTSIFGSREPTLKKSFLLESDDEDDGNTIRKKDSPARAALTMTAQVSDQSIQTDLSTDFFETIAKDAQSPKRSIVLATMSGTARGGAPQSPSVRSQSSMESFGRGRGRMSSEGVRLVSGGSSTTGRSESSSGMHEPPRMRFPPLPENYQEQIAAAQQKVGGTPEQNAMLPPPIPTHRSNVSFRPRTPRQHDQSARPETPVSHGDSTPKPPRFSATRSEISSPGSRRSSLSSFATELDDRFNMQNDTYPKSGDNMQTTDPRVIQAITQTMIGEYLWKYTRNAGRGSISHTRHKRFFWIHPYTRTLYWSDRDPQSAGRAELRAKSVAIEAVRVVTDDNPMPPGLHRKSLVIITPGRMLKFTAPTSQRHETWFNALSYLLLRDGQEVIVEDSAVNDDDLRDYNPGYSAESSLLPTMRAAASLSSFRSRVTRDSTRESSPTRNASSLSHRRPGERDRMQGSLSRLSNIFRPSSGFGSYSSRHDNSVYGISEGSDSREEDLHQHYHEEGSDRMENVRACCDGKHDVGTLSRKGGKKALLRARNGAHVHSHSH